MSEREPTPRDPCDRYAPALAMLDAPDLDPDERRAALAHLAGCARCQADQRAYARLDADLRHAFGLGGAAPLRTADLLAAIGATHEPTTRVTMRSVVDLGHLDDTERMYRMHDTDRRDDVSAPARKMATPPTLRTGLDARSGRQGWKAGLGAAAVALVVIVIAATLFSMRSHGSSTLSTGAAATRTAQAQSYAGAVPEGYVTTASMDSPTDGWAIGLPATSSVPPTPSGGSAGPATLGAVFYHYTGSAWVPAVSVAGFGVAGPEPSLYIKMFSPTDGWAFDGDRHLLRYDGKAWRAATIDLSGREQVTHVQALDMVSPTDGWAAAYVKGGVAGAGVTSFLHYDGQRWTLDQSNLALPSWAAASQSTINGISETPGGDVWATGVAPTPTNESGGGLVFHRVNGVWRVAATLQDSNAATTISPTGIYMSSPTSGWIIGGAYENKTTSEGTSGNVHVALLRYDGVRWSPVSVSLATVAISDTLQQIVATGPDDIWVSGQSSARTATSTGIEMTSFLLRYDGHSWSQVTPNVAASGISDAYIYSVSPAPDGSLWAIGWVALSENGRTSPLFWRYRDGVWSAFPVTSGK